MADPREIEGWRNAHKSFSRAQLVQVLHEKMPFSPEHIAAKQALDALDQSAQERTYTIARRTYGWTILGALAAVIAAAGALWPLFPHPSVHTSPASPPQATPTATPHTSAATSSP